MLSSAPMSYEPSADTEPEEMRPKSRISGFYKMPLQERWAELVARGILDEEDVSLLSTESKLPLGRASTMIENAIGVFELPLGLGLNFLINGIDYVIPMAIEEPSVVAAVSHVAALVRRSGGFEAESDGSRMIGQIQVVGVEDLVAATDSILEARPRLLARANTFEPGMVERGGGAVDIEVRTLSKPGFPTMMVAHLIVDACDAMGANMVNTMAEGIADDIEALTGGKVFLRILSNLADQRLVRATCRIPFADLEWRGYSGQEVAEGVELASHFAELDPYRATTHNKGVMNGISAVCIATGNDWRAIESGAHAWAAREGQYGPIATWRVDGEFLVGRIELPMAIGTVGGTIPVHPTVQLAHKILRVGGACELGGVMAAVGLAQNLGALKALATEGIQRGHMSMHARSVAVAAGATDDELSEVVERLVDSGDIKVTKATEILEILRA